MFYEAVAADGKRSIGLATSASGKHDWQRHPAPILTASDNPDAWDCDSVGTPCAVAMSEGRWRLYYAGRSQQHGPWEGIGLALGVADSSSGQVQISFKRRTGKKGAAPTDQN